MKKLLGAMVLLLTVTGCSTKYISSFEYYEPTADCRIEVNYTNEHGVKVHNVKGPLKKETHIKTDGANEFSPGKEFNTNISVF